MREISFSIPVSGVIRIDGDEIAITVNKADTIVVLGPEIKLGGRGFLDPGKTMFDIILESAREVIRRKGFNRFSAPDLYNEAKKKYPLINRGSFMSRVIACTPDHPSYKHHKSTKDYFSRIGPGLYWLNEKYTADSTAEEMGPIFNP